MVGETLAGLADSVGPTSDDAPGDLARRFGKAGEICMHGSIQHGVIWKGPIEEVRGPLGIDDGGNSVGWKGLARHRCVEAVAVQTTFPP